MGAFENLIMPDFFKSVMMKVVTRSLPGARR